MRLSLGGVKDEAEIRGHRRTYVGSMPGRIIQGIHQAGTNNPVFMMDEVDKIGADFRGDPSSALLEVLDPEQNNAFRDHYLGVPFDLSNVMFICTANLTDTIQPAFLDRMEVIRLSGYTEDEKLEIAKRHLVPKQLEEHGLTPEHLVFTDQALARDHQQLHARGGPAQPRARDRGHLPQGRAQGGRGPARAPCSVTPANAAQVPGRAQDPARGDAQEGRRSASPPAWPGPRPAATCCSSRPPTMKGKGRLTLTGQLGDVMKESAQAALSYARATRARSSASRTSSSRRHDLHVHVPEGAIPKDGPSAGITMATAMLSVAHRPRRAQRALAMTGEITLRGNVLPDRRAQGEDPGRPPRRHRRRSSARSSTRRTSTRCRCTCAAA